MSDRPRYQHEEEKEPTRSQLRKAMERLREQRFPRVIEPRETRDRDRSVSGKRRRLERKANQRAERA